MTISFFFFKLVVVKLVLPCCSLLFKGMILKAAASVRIRIGIWISFKKLQRGIEEVKTLWNVHTYREGKVTGSYGKLPSNPRYQTREEGARVWIRRDKRNSWRGPSLYVENLLKRFDRPFQIVHFSCSRFNGFFTNGCQSNLQRDITFLIENWKLIRR